MTHAKKKKHITDWPKNTNAQDDVVEILRWLDLFMNLGDETLLETGGNQIQRVTFLRKYSALVIKRLHMLCKQLSRTIL